MTNIVGFYNKDGAQLKRKEAEYKFKRLDYSAPVWTWVSRP